MSDNPKGQSLGRATATIFMVADKFADGLRVVQRVSAEAGKAVDQIGGAFDRARKAAQDFDKTPLGKLNTAIKGIRDQIALVSVAAAGMTVFGVKAAQDINRTRTSIDLLTGSVQKADKVFADVRKLTDKFNIPFDDAIKGAQSFLPMAKQTGIAVEELVKSAIRFQAYAPRKNFDEIKFSINEALSGDFVSIKDALDLSRKQRDQLKKTLEEQGPQALLAGLNDILVERGFDDKTLEKLGESGANAFEQIRSEIKETLGTAFTPLLKDFVLPTIKRFGEFLRTIRETNPDLLKFGAGITAVVAAGAPLLTFLSAAIAAYKALKVASAGAGLAGALGKAGPLVKGGLAIGGGIAAGLGVATFAARNLGVETGDLKRIKNGEDAGGVLVERLKQVLVILVDGFLSFSGVIAKAVVYIGNAINQFINVFKVGGTLISEIFGNLRMTFGQFIVAIGGVLKSIPGQGINGALLEQAGGDEKFAANTQINAARSDRDNLMRELARGFTPRQEDLDAIDKNIQSMKDTVVGGLIDILFPEKAKQVFDNTSKVVQEGVDKINGILGDSEEYLQQQAADIADSTQKYNDDITAMEAKKQQDIIDLNNKFAADQIQIAKDRVKAEKQALDDLNNDLAKINQDLARDTDKEGRERERKNKEIEIDFQRAELEDAQAHADKLIKIQADNLKKQENAIENFDFATLFDLSEDLKTQTDSANEEFDKQRRERLQALQYEREDLVREFGVQREERLIQYEQDRADRAAEYDQERQRIATESAEKLLMTQQSHANDLAQLQNKFVTEQQLRQQAYQQELTLLMQTEAQRAAIMAQTQALLLEQAYSFMNQVGAIKQGVNSGASTRNYESQMDVYRRQQDERDRQSEEERAKSGRTSGRAFGGPVLSGHTYVVSELNPERFKRGAQTYELPNSTGLFTPLSDGSIQPGGGRPAPQLNVSVAINAPIDSGILTMDQAIAMIQRGAREGAEQVLSEFMDQYDR